jgi:hypothetical protein
LRRARARLLGGLALVLATGWSPSPVHAAAALPSIALRPNCGPVGTGPPAPPAGPPPPTYTIEVIGRNLSPGEADVIFNPGVHQQAFAGNIDTAGAEDDVVHPITVPAGTYTVTVQPFNFGEGPPPPSASAIFLVPCPPPPVSPPPTTPRPSAPPSPGASPTPRGSPPPVLNPTLTLTPAVGPPGTVTVAHGADFPANTGIQLTWNQGIAASTSSAIATDASGSFTATVLLFPHDELGTRILTAVSILPPNSSQFGFASASFLVVPGQVQPNDFSWRR